MEFCFGFPAGDGRLLAFVLPFPRSAARAGRAERGSGIQAGPDTTVTCRGEEFMRGARRASGRWVAIAGVAAMLALGQRSIAADPAKGEAALYEAAAAAAARGNTEKTKMLGFGIIKTAFTEVPREGAVLVGFDLGVGKFLNIDTIYAIRAVFRAADGEASYTEQGLFKDKRGSGKHVTKSKVTRTVRVRARPGYAVGGVTLRTGLNINGLAVIFMRIDGTKLDPNRSYLSEWVGDRTGGSEATISGLGAPVIGVFGNKDADHVMALGLVCLQQPERPVAVQPPRPAPAIAPPRQEPAAAPPRPAAPPRRDVRPDPPPAEAPPRVLDKHRDHEFHFSLTIPDGWRRMSRKEQDLIRAVVRQRGFDDIVQYETGFRPDGSALGTFPYVLIQVHKIKTAGMSYQQIQDSLNLGIDKPLKVVEEKFSDVLRNLTAERPVLDRPRNRIALRLQSDVAGIGKVEAFSMCHLGAESVVCVHCYAKEEGFARLFPIFTDINNSFAFDDGHDFVATKESVEGGSWAAYLVFGGVTVLLGFSFLAFAGRNQHARLETASHADRAPTLPSSTGSQEGPGLRLPIAPIVVDPDPPRP